MLKKIIPTPPIEAFIPIDPNILSKEGLILETYLLKRVIGQDEAVKQLVRVYQTFCSGLQNPRRPLGVLLFLGPTGSGKTRLVEVLAESLFGDSGAMLKIDCAEFTHDHEVAKLIGSPPGYLGHDKTDPRISQRVLDRYQTEELKVSILLFDEIEKGCDDLHALMLGMLSDATLTLGNNTTVDLTRTLIIMTSNVGSEDLQKIISGNGLGFTSTIDSITELDVILGQTAKESLKKAFPPEFLNRINKSIVFHTLSDASLKLIINIEIEAIQDRLLTAGYFILLRITNAAKDYIRKEGTDPIYGARELTRSLDRLMVEPISNLLATGQVKDTDLLVVSYDSGDHLTFSKVEGTIKSPPPPLQILAI
jgi:ATP-dependent Clp protease ATP-binding subunit ClpA